MKRIASLVTAAALAGSLLAARDAAQAQSAMYLVPISDLSATYAPGAIVKFAAVIDLGTNKFGSFSVPAAVAYVTSEFGPKPTALADTQASDPNSVFDLAAPIAYTTTASLIGGEKVYAIQSTTGHSAMQNANGTATIAAPGGTYTIATFSFPISPAIRGNTATVYLPTVFGYTDQANNSDGAFQSGKGPLLQILGKNVLGVPISDTLTFPNTGGKFSSLTFNIIGGGAPFASVTGTLQFSQIAPNAAAQHVTLQFRDPGTGAVLYTQTASVPPNGAFSLAPEPLQPYTLWVKADRFLAATAPILVTGNTFAPIALAFDGGDANNDNSVDTADFSLFVGAYGGMAGVSGSSYDIRADFNGDGSVDPTDFGILVESYGEQGEL